MPLPATITQSSLNGYNGFVIGSPGAGSFFGFDVASAGDLNGDGLMDLVVGAFNLNTSYVIFGRTSGFPASFDLASLNGTNGFSLVGPPGESTGRTVSSVGDVNGDGFDDLAIADPNSALVGRAFIVFGQATPYAPSLSLAALDGSNGVILEGVAMFDQAGASLSSAGDINGDGYDDILVGAPASDPAGSASGAAYVVFGSATPVSYLSLSTLDGSNGFRLPGLQAYGELGVSVSSAGDVNNDGFDDLIVGGHRIDNDNPNDGAAFVVFGKASGFAANVDLAGLDGGSGFTIIGADIDGKLGRSVSSAGDINGDGFDDVVVGAYNAGIPASGAPHGEAYVIFGKASGFAATIRTSELNGGNGFRITVNSFLTDSLGFNVSGAGDVNADGFDDLLVSAPYAPDGGNARGAAYVVYGKAGGFAASLNVASIDGSNGVVITGEGADNQQFGFSAAILGDINGDGGADMAFGFPRQNAYTGGAIVVFGNDPRVNFNGGGGDETSNGGAFNDTLNGNGGKDILSGLGGDDDLRGGDGNDTLYGGDGADDIIGGNGNDILDGGDGDDFMLDAVGANKFNGGDGNDVISGGAGAERLDGGAGNDNLTGGGGNDYLDGGTGSNVLIGGFGNDIFIVRSGSDNVFEVFGQGTDTVRSTISYTLVSNVEVLELLSGTDIDGTGNDLANTLKGNGGANTLSGLAGADKILGGGGNDVLIGGVGRDQLTGGAGADTFRVLEESVGLSTLEIDTVLDYELGVDRLDFSQIDANGAADGDPAFTLSTTGLHRIAGELYVFYTASQDTTTVRLDVNGDGRADYQMGIKGDVVADAGTWLL